MGDFEQRVEWHRERVEWVIEHFAFCTIDEDGVHPPHDETDDDLKELLEDA